MLPGLRNKPLLSRLTLSDLSASVQALINGALQKSGGTMTGALVLGGDATLALHPATKQQLDAGLSPRMQYSLTATQPTTSGLAIDFPSLPSWAKRLTLNLRGVSLNGSAVPLVQVGAGSVASSGYDSACSTITGAVGFSTATALSGFTFNTQAAADSLSGSLILTKLKDHTWVAQMAGKAGSNISFLGGGEVVLGGALDRLRLTTVAGTATFDAGEASLLIEG